MDFMYAVCLVPCSDCHEATLQSITGWIRDTFRCLCRREASARFRVWLGCLVSSTLKQRQGDKVFWPLTLSKAPPTLI